MRQERIKIGQQELSVGDEFTFKLNPIPAPKEPVLISAKVEDVRGGGFYGKSIIFEDFVVKTTEPDPWHLLWRRLNWAGYPFPPQSIESAAQLDHISSRIIHLVVPHITNDTIITPDSFGYTNIGPLGFSQVIERVRGRGALFNSDTDENEKVKQVRQQLWGLGVALGLEQVAQVHPGNPFGKQNLWIGKDGQFIWLDTLPAIVHTGGVLPGFRFPFHYDIRENIGDGRITFNRLHTKKFRAYLSDNPSSIPDSTRHELEYYLAEYDAIWPEYAEEMTKEQKDLVIEDAEMRGLVTEDEAVRLRKSKAVYFKFLAKHVINPAIQSFAEFIEDKFAYNTVLGELKKDTNRFLKGPFFRHQIVFGGALLAGFREAYLLGLVSPEEWEGNNPELVRHYFKRGLIASFSKILRPWGGWNSDLEEKLWQMLRMENR